MMAPIKSNDTKEKILEIASRLFAENGYDGTSVRDIASEAEVNVAAINYHFTNKQTLYWTVTLASHQWLASNIERLANETKDTETLCLSLFDFLVENGGSLKNAFMMFLSGSVPDIDEELLSEMVMQKEVGPPGGQFIGLKIQQEFGGDLPVDGVKWAVKNIFTLIIQTALMMETSHCQILYKDHPDFQPEFVRKQMADNVRSALEFLRNHSDQWQD